MVRIDQLNPSQLQVDVAGTAFDPAIIPPALPTSSQQLDLPAVDVAGSAFDPAIMGTPFDPAAPALVTAKPMKLDDRGIPRRRLAIDRLLDSRARLDVQETAGDEFWNLPDDMRLSALNTAREKYGLTPVTDVPTREGFFATIGRKWGGLGVSGDEGVLDRLPVGGTGAAIQDAREVMNIQSLLQGGHELTTDQLETLANLSEEEIVASTRTALGNVAAIASDTPAYVGEIAISGGIANMARAGAQSAARATVRKGMLSLLRSALSDGLRGSQIKTALAEGLRDSAARAIVTAPAIVKNIAGPNQGVTVDTNEAGQATIAPIKGDDIAPAVSKAVVDHVIESVSERSGPVFESLIAKSAAKLGAGRILAKAEELAPDVVAKLRRLNQATKPAREFGYNDVLAEMGEERVGQLARWLVTEAGLDLGVDSPLPSGEQLATEAGGFALFGGGLRAATGAARYAQNRSRENQIAKRTGLRVEDVREVIKAMEAEGDSSVSPPPVISEERPSVSEKAPIVPPSGPSVSETPPAKASTTGLTEAFKDLGSGMMDGFYGGIFKSLQEGKDTFAGVKDPLIAKAREAFAAGLIKSPEDLREFAKGTLKATPPGQSQIPAAAPTNAPEATAAAEAAASRGDGRDLADLSALPVNAREEIDRGYSDAAKAGVIDLIESAAAEGKTADQIAMQIGPKLLGSLNEKRDIVRSVRTKLGIPSIEAGPAQFEKWRQSRGASSKADNGLESAGGSETSPLTPQTTEKQAPNNGLKSEAETPISQLPAEEPDPTATADRILKSLPKVAREGNQVMLGKPRAGSDAEVAARILTTLNIPHVFFSSAKPTGIPAIYLGGAAVKAGGAGERGGEGGRLLAIDLRSSDGKAKRGKRGAVLGTVMHEWVHDLKGSDPATYDELRKWLVKNAPKLLKTAEAEYVDNAGRRRMNDLVQRLMSNEALLQEEAVASAVEIVFSSESMLRQLKADKPSLLKRFVEFLKKMLEKLPANLSEEVKARMGVLELIRTVAPELEAELAARSTPVSTSPANAVLTPARPAPPLSTRPETSTIPKTATLSPSPAESAPRGISTATAADVPFMVEAAKKNTRELGFIPAGAIEEKVAAGNALVARNALGKSVGFVVFNRKPNTLTVVQTWVAPEVRRFGVGQALVDAVVDRARADGANFIQAGVGEDMAAALKFWQRQGFERVGKEQGGVERKRGLVLLSRELAPPPLLAADAKFSIEGEGEKLTPHDTPDVIEARRISRSMPQTHTIDTPERRALRAAIVEALYGFGARLKNRVAYVIIGPPAAGKSTLADPLAEQAGALIVDSDKAKALLQPEYQNGLGAMAVHQESSVINTTLLRRAMTAGDNIVLPIVGKDLNGLQKVADELKAAGYEVHLSLVDLDRDKATLRAIARFNKDKRFVDPDYVYNTVGNKPQKVYNDIRGQNDKFNSFLHVSSDVPIGQLPRIIEHSENLPGVLRQVLGREGSPERALRLGGTDADVQDRARSGNAGAPAGKVTPSAPGRSEERDTPQKQIDAVPLVKNADGKLLAPNGKPSLQQNEYAWRLVRTPNFKKWFGDWEKSPATASKVVDENGEPLVLYHGTNSTFTQFVPAEGDFGKGIYLATSAERARLYGDTIMAVYARVLAARPSAEPKDGYKTGAGDWLVKSPNQIKSATGNTGEFSDDPDIRYSLEEGDAQEDSPVSPAATPSPPPGTPAPPPSRANPASLKHWTKDQARQQLVAGYKADVDAAVGQLADMLANKQTGLHPDDLEAYTGWEKGVLSNWVNEDGWSERPLSSADIDMILSSHSSTKLRDEALASAKASPDPAQNFLAWYVENRDTSRKRLLDASTPEKLRSLVGQTLNINGIQFVVGEDAQGQVWLASDSEQFPVDILGEIPHDVGTLGKPEIPDEDRGARILESPMDLAAEVARQHVEAGVKPEWRALTKSIADTLITRILTKDVAAHKKLALSMSKARSLAVGMYERAQELMREGADPARAVEVSIRETAASENEGRGRDIQSALRAIREALDNSFSDIRTVADAAAEASGITRGKALRRMLLETVQRHLPENLQRQMQSALANVETPGQLREALEKAADLLVAYEKREEVRIFEGLLRGSDVKHLVGGFRKKFEMLVGPLDPKAPSLTSRRMADLLTHWLATRPQDAQAAGRYTLPQNAQVLLDRLKKTPVSELSVEELKGVNDTIRALVTQNAAERVLMFGRAEQQLEDVAREVVREASMRSPELPRQAVGGKGSVEQLGDVGRIVNALGGEANSPLVEAVKAFGDRGQGTKLLVHDVRRGQERKYGILQRVYNSLGEVLADHKQTQHTLIDLFKKPAYTGKVRIFEGQKVQTEEESKRQYDKAQREMLSFFEDPAAAGDDWTRQVVEFAKTGETGRAGGKPDLRLAAGDKLAAAGIEGEITIRGGAIPAGVVMDDGVLSFESLRNLPEALNNPAYIFEKPNGAKVVLTEQWLGDTRAVELFTLTPTAGAAGGGWEVKAGGIRYVHTSNTMTMLRTAALGKMLWANMDTHERWKATAQGTEAATEVNVLPDPSGDTIQHREGAPGESIDEREIILTSMERTALYAYSQNPDSLNKLLDNGFLTERSAGAADRTLRIAAADLRSILETVTPFEKALAAMMFEHGDAMFPQLNDLHIRMKGFELEKQEKYFPLILDRNQLDQLADNLRNINPEQWPEAMGLLKRRVRHRVPVVLTNALETFLRSAANSATFVGLAEPVRNARLILGESRVADTLRQRQGSAFATRAEDMLKSEVNALLTDRLDSDRLVNELTRNLAVATLGFRIPTTALNFAGQIPMFVSQFAGRPMAGARTRALAAASAQVAASAVVSPKKTLEAAKQALFQHPYLWYRFDGGGDSALRSATQTRATGSVGGGGRSGLPSASTHAGQTFRNAQELAMSGMKNAEMLAVYALYKGLKRVHANPGDPNSLSESKILELVADITRDTANPATALEQSAIYRAGKRNPYLGMLLMFTGDAAKKRDVLVESYYRLWRDGGRDGKKAFGAALGSVAVAVLVVGAMIKWLWKETMNGWQPDDDREKSDLAWFGRTAALESAGIVHPAVSEIAQTLMGMTGDSLQGRAASDVVKAGSALYQLTSQGLSTDRRSDKGTGELLVAFFDRFLRGVGGLTGMPLAAPLDLTKAAARATGLARKGGGEDLAPGERDLRRELAELRKRVVADAVDPREKYGDLNPAEIRRYRHLEKLSRMIGKVRGNLRNKRVTEQWATRSIEQLVKQSQSKNA